MQPPVLATLLLLLGGLAAPAVDARVVRLPGGDGPSASVHGGACKTAAVDAFFSIPYAEPPVGALRWAAPRPWSAASSAHTHTNTHTNTSSCSNGDDDSGVIINATVPAPACVQFGREFAEEGPQSEGLVSEP